MNFDHAYSHFDGPVVPDEQVIKPTSDFRSTMTGLRKILEEMIKREFLT